MVSVTKFIAEIPISVEDIKPLNNQQCTVKVLPLKHEFKHYPGREGQVEQKLVLYVDFLGKARPLKVNERMAARLSAFFSSEDTDQWSGKTFALVPAKKGIVEYIDVRMK